VIITINGRAYRVLEIRDDAIVAEPLDGGPQVTLACPPSAA
jgi:hypothetical protein